MKNLKILFLLSAALLCGFQGTWAMEEQGNQQNPKVILAKAACIEQEFWNSCSGRPYKSATSRAVKKLFDPTAGIAPSERVDFSQMKKWEIVKHLDDVLSRKHKARSSALPNKPGTPQKKYITRFIKSGHGDDSPERISYQGRNFTLSLNYNGSDRTKQPGNSYLEEEGRWPLAYDSSYGINLANPDVHLLLLVEISRRHAFDPQRALPDEFADLPVGLGLAMASRLINNGVIQLNDFWEKGGQYHIYSYSGSKREDRFMNIYNMYHQHYMNDLTDEEEVNSHLKDLMYNYFEVPDEGLSVAFSGLGVGISDEDFDKEVPNENLEPIIKEEKQALADSDVEHDSDEVVALEKAAKAALEKIGPEKKAN